jgi:hypothetical protein
MTAACLQLLFEAGRPIWPWGVEERGLLIEAFPAAQLRQWGLPYQAYNGNTDIERQNRASIVCSLSKRIDMGNFREKLESCADALDSVICAFAAIAVVNDCSLKYGQSNPLEGQVAIHA